MARLLGQHVSSWIVHPFRFFSVTIPCRPRFRCLARGDVAGGMLSRRFGSAALRHGQRIGCPQASRPSPTPELLPPEPPVDEEMVPGYKVEHYYPTHPGEVLEDMYQLNAKIGWGSSATVWLAHDIQRYPLCRRCTSVLHVVATDKPMPF